MHENTRLLLCRAGFVLLCVLPTLGTIASVVYLRSDAYLTARREDWQATLSQRLGLKVEIDRVSYPEMNIALLQSVRLKCPETSELLASAFAVEVAWRDGEWEVDLNLPEVDSTHVGRLQRTLTEQVVQRFPESFATVYVKSEQASITGPRGRATFSDFEAIVESSAHGPSAEAVFKIVGVEMKEPVEVTLLRNRARRGASWKWTFKTNDAAIPCDVVALFAPEWSTLGPEARVSGFAQGNWSDQSRDWTLNGKLDHVALDRWPWGGRAPASGLGEANWRRTITGLAEVDVKRFDSIDGRLAALDVSVRSTTTGTIGREVVERAADAFQLEPGAFAKNKDREAFDLLAFDVRLTKSGLSLRGMADPNRPGALVHSSRAGGEAILREREPRPVPSIALAHFLSPPTRDSVPATLESSDWLKKLLPASGPRASKIEQAGHAAGNERR